MMLRMCYPKSSVTDWGYDLPALLDFGPHLFSILLSKGYNVEKIIEMQQGKNGFFMMLSVNRDSKISKVSLSGSRDGDINGLSVNGTLCNWEDDLFDKQLNDLHKEQRRIEWKQMLRLENMAKEYLL